MVKKVFDGIGGVGGVGGVGGAGGKNLLDKRRNEKSQKKEAADVKNNKTLPFGQRIIPSFD